MSAIDIHELQAHDLYKKSDIFYCTIIIIIATPI